MKKLIFGFFFLVVISLSVFLTVSVLQTSISITALCQEVPEYMDVGGSGGGYTTGCPGVQNRRKSQAVQCAGGGWVIKPGCCSGNMRCDAMNPCNGQQFICHGGLCDPES